MGHRRLGELPATRNWQSVVALLRLTDDPARIAEETSKAADKGLQMAKEDWGMARVLRMLMEAVRASGANDCTARWTRLGMTMPKEASLLDFVAAFDDAMDKSLRSRQHRSDLAEMARYAAVDALTQMCQRETGSLFGVSLADTQRTLKKYTTTKNFGQVGHDFFGKFLYRFLDYHLSRELPNHIGPKKQFKTIEACQGFKEALKLHCYQTARIVREFSGCWPSAADYRRQLHESTVRTQFMPVAFSKIKSELKKRERGNA